MIFDENKHGELNESHENDPGQKMTLVVKTENDPGFHTSINMKTENDPGSNMDRKMILVSKRKMILVFGPNHVCGDKKKNKTFKYRYLNIETI